MTTSRQILVIEDDHKTVELIRLYLERDGYQVAIAYNGREGLDLARQRRLDLIVLDLMLPKVGGLDICRILRMEQFTMPIIMLTAKSTEDDLLLGLDLGADDYMTKPFSPRELAARVRTVLRRVTDLPLTPKQTLQFGELIIDPLRHEASLCGELLPLTPKEFKLLETMGKEPGRAFTRLELLQLVFGFDYAGLERTVDAHIMNLRKKLEAQSEPLLYIQTVYGIGYRFAWEPDAA
ncbi:response regulator transcription factor [soil metagenome]